MTDVPSRTLPDPPFWENLFKVNRTDSRGRLWRFNAIPYLVEYVGNASFSWTCSDCGGSLVQGAQTIIHDEVVIESPDGAMDSHDCDEERVRRVVES